MSHGFLALNNSNQVLVSSDTRNLHFVQKLTTFTTESSTDYYGGLRRITFRATCNTVPVPFFTCPTSDYYCVTSIKNMGGDQWDIELIRSGTSEIYPELYVFADPRGKTATDSHGMVVYRDDGTPAFDSRLTPLVVSGGVQVGHPSNPRPTFPYNLSARYCESLGSASGGHFEPTEYLTFSVPITPSKPMFLYSSLAQAQREAHYHDSEQDCLGFDAYGACAGYGTEENWDSYYWCFYRGGIKPVGNSILAGWIAVHWGCNWTYSKDTSLGGIGIGGDGGSGGSWPYSNETLNLTGTAVIIADASRYD